ncbi:beta-galactosidase/beta-glucuronidase [Flavobacterium piscis]|uniref:Beta-galactosidase/beta-glucuronidase n=1 Tax=Flavobacterium piscis TaxID=1114874 RepID=A0ABU1Y801_9FLAO|nr:beta-galactosidase/beta-glucuronidase [Flavobacterium piscis]
MSNPRLWTLETPFLYQTQIQILKGKKMVDETKTDFGICSIKFTDENGFQLNGKTVAVTLV